MAQKTSELAVKAEGGSIAVISDDLLEFGTGLEHVTSDDTTIPYLRVLQALSPELNKNDGKYIQGAEQGNLLNTGLGDVYDGDVGALVVPCYYEKRYVEWIPREKGGGKVEDHKSRDILTKCTKNDIGKFLLENGNEVIETAYFYVMLCTEDESQWSTAVISMSSSQLAKARKWIMQLQARRVQNSAGKMVDAPMFAFKYRVKTVAEQNDRGSWYGYSIGLEGPTTNVEIMKEGQKLLKMIKGGEVSIKEEETESDELNDEVPF